MNTTEASTVNHPVVSKERWVAERVKLLAREATPLRLAMSNDGLELVAVTQDVGQAHESLDAKFEGTDLTVAFNDPTAGKTFADQFLQQNGDVDVMFQIAGKTGNGVLQSVEENGIYGLGVDVDQWISTPDSAECIVTSAEKKLTLAVSEGIIAMGDDAPRSGNVPYDASNEGIGLSPYYQFADLIDSETQAAIDDAFSQMAAGELDPCMPSGLCYAGEADPGT